MFCSLVLKRLTPRTLGGNHLSTSITTRLFICSFPSEECPYHSLGFSLVGFTAFHSIRFRTDYVSVALFREPNPYLHEVNVGLIPAVNALCAKPRLIYSPSTNTTDISEPCEHGLSSTKSSFAAIT